MRGGEEDDGYVVCLECQWRKAKGDDGYVVAWRVYGEKILRRWLLLDSCGVVSVCLMMVWAVLCCSSLLLCCGV